MKKVRFYIQFLFCLIVVNSALYGQIITTVAGGATGHGGYWGEGGLATNAQIGIFGGLSIDKYGNIYIVDGSPRVYKVDATTGIIHTVAGTGVAGYNGDNMQATAAQLNNPGLIITDDVGNFYISDVGNYRIRKVDIATGIITTFAGNGTLGYSGDNGPAIAADFDFNSFTFDVSGNMILTTTDYRIRKIDPPGMITTIAGIGVTGNAGDGAPATTATMTPNGDVGTDRFGNIYFSDSFLSVRKINVSTGIITRVAGTGNNMGYPYSGDGSIATNAHTSPVAVAVDDTGNLYIADDPNSRIEKVDTFGIIHSIVGTGVHGYNGDGGLADTTEINYPENVALDRCGNLYIADFNNARVRKVTFNPTCNPDEALSVKEAETGAVSVYPNPVNDKLTITANSKISNVTISNFIGQVVYASPGLSTGGEENEKAEVNISGLPEGMYIVRVTDEEGRMMITKIVKE